MGIGNKDGNEFRRRSRRAVALLFAALNVTCTGNEQAAPPRQRSIIADVIVSVDNHTSNSVAIYVNTGAVSDSLGVVPGRSIKSFSMPWEVGAPLNLVWLEARGRHGAPDARSESFRLPSGHRIIWMLDRTRTGTVTMR